MTRAPKRGRPATASRADVIREVSAQYLNGQRVDLTVVAQTLRLGRATIYRWFGSREALLGEVIATQLERLIATKRAHVRRRGAAGLLEVFDLINRSLARSAALRRLLEQERAAAMRMLTSSSGPVQPRAVAAIERLIDEEVARGTYRPAADASTLAYAIVRLAEAFLYNDAIIGIRGDCDRLHDVEAVLLGVATAPAQPQRSARRRRASAAAPP